MNGSARTFGDETATVERASSRVNAPLTIALGSLVLVAALYWPTSLEIADLWQDTVRRRYTHGWLVLAITVWLIWRDRAHLRSIALTPPSGGWCVVALGSVGWLVGLNAGLLAMTTLAMPLLVLAAIWAAAGQAIARRVSFAVLYLYFALPAWELVNPALQSLTALVNVWLTRVAGIPVTVEGNVIQIPAGSFEIAGGCSGLHFLVVALAIAALQGEIDRYSWRSRWALIGLAALLALVTNWLRVFIIIVAGQLTDMQHFLVKVDHYYFGWFMFVFALGSYLYLSSRVPRGSGGETPSAQLRTATPRSRAVTAVALSAAALLLGPVWSLAASGANVEPGVEAPPKLAGWSGPGLHLSAWHPVFANPDNEYLVAYRSDSAGDVALYRAVYHSQRQGKELRGHGNSVLGASYKSKESRRREIALAGGIIPITEQLAEGVEKRDLLVWSLFTVDGKHDPMGIPGRLAYGVRSLVRSPTASVMALAAECRPDCESARIALHAVAIEALPALISSPEAGPMDASITGSR
jgi:exosortase A